MTETTSLHGTERARAIGFAILGAVAFGTLAIFAKAAYDEGATPIPLLTIRFLVAAALLAVFQLARGKSLWIGRAAALRLGALGAFGYAFEATLFFAALERAPAAIVGLVFYSYPLWTALAGFATGLEPFRMRLLAALALGIFGIALIFSIPETGLAGPLLALAASLAVTAYFLTAQVFVRDVDPTAAATYTATGAGIACLVGSIVSTQGLPAGAIPAGLALGVVTAVAFACLYAAVARMGSAHTGVAMMFEPVTTVVLAAIFLDEELTIKIAIGTLLVVAALPILAFSKPDEPTLVAADSM